MVPSQEICPAGRCRERTTPAPGADLPRRIPPQLGADGAPLELSPPHGGRWLRDADGGLSPADADTAAGAGLAFFSR